MTFVTAECVRYRPIERIAPLISRRSLIAASAALASVGASGIPAFAKAPPAGRQVPGVFRRKVGSIEVTALSDGFGPIGLEAFPNLDAADALRLLEAVGQKTMPPTAINAFVVNTSAKTYLVDTGMGSNRAFGNTLGRMRANLAAAGIEPSQIDAVILTHAHPDHAEGLLTPEGKARFRNAEVFLHENEANFWLDEGTFSRAPEGAKPFFLSARNALRPYANRTRKVKEGELAPGLFLQLAAGHTPGHAVIRVSSGKDQLLMAGDTLHNALIHTLRPETVFAFDIDGKQAAESRKRIFDMVATDGIPIAATHVPFPGFGRIIRDGQAYRYVPDQWGDLA
jgi:glyoxylase-like metal-dependent hydrolase (beta-lactamase superfamily II)